MTNERSILTMSIGRQGEIAQRRVADPEVVDRDPHPELAQALDGGLGDLDLEERGFGDLDDQPLGRQATGIEALAEAGDDVRADELARREVDADPRPRDRRAPARGRPARLVDDPVGERSDEPARLGHRDELAGRDQPTVAHPANEGLVADGLAGPEIDDRLVVEPKVASRRSRRPGRSGAGAGSWRPRASTARRPRRGPCRDSWRGTSRRRRCGRARRRSCPRLWRRRRRCWRGR